MMEEFQRMLNEKLRERNMTLKKLAEISGIALKHLENLSAGRFERLPAAPYLRGYLVKLGLMLEFDGEKWWEELRNQGVTKSSGAGDELPRNRFAPEPFKKKMWISVIIIIVALYALIRLPYIIGRPSLNVRSPEEAVTNVSVPEFVLAGAVKNADELRVNDEFVEIAGDGSWTKTIMLQPGLNTVKISARKFLGRETETIRQIIYEIQGIDAMPTSSLPIPIEPDGEKF